jgi:methionine biosynthesis protein metW
MSHQHDIQHFYDTIAAKYDLIFPLSPAHKAFFDSELSAGQHVLDIGAATGSLAAYLQHKGLEVTAIDLSESLIAQARAKGVAVLYKDMLTIGDLPHTYDAMINIGNTLPHLNGLSTVEHFLQQAHSKLRIGGKLIVQVVNFALYLAQRKEDYLGDLPLIDKPEVRFERSYYLKDAQTIRFKAVLDSHLHAEEDLTIITCEQLTELLAKVGFAQVQHYGNFKKEPFDEKTSKALVVVSSRE